MIGRLSGLEFETAIASFDFRRTSRHVHMWNHVCLILTLDIGVQQRLDNASTLGPLDGICTGGSPATAWRFPRASGNIAFPKLNAYSSPFVHAIMLSNNNNQFVNSISTRVGMPLLESHEWDHLWT